MTQILIKKIINKEKLSKSGKPYKSCSILTVGKDGQEIWLNSFANSTTESWEAGQTVDLEIEKTEYGYKFKEPKERNVLTEIDKLNAKIDLLVVQMAKIVNSATQAPKTSQNAILTPKTTEEITVEECEKIFGEDPGVHCSDIPDFLR